MFKFLSKHIHWLLVIFVAINVVTLIMFSTYSKQDLVALAFSVTGLMAVSYLAYQVEVKKRKENKRK